MTGLARHMGYSAAVALVSVNGANKVTVLDEVYDSFAMAGIVVEAENRISLRETTIMPSLLGMIETLTLLFAPAIEFAYNERSQCTGFLAGLGSNGLRVSTGIVLTGDFIEKVRHNK